MIDPISSPLYGITIMVICGILLIYFLYREIKERKGSNRKKYILQTGLFFVIFYILFWLFLVFVLLEPN